MGKGGCRWNSQGPESTTRIRFMERNPYGVLDHYVDMGSGSEIHVPVRVVQNGHGAEVPLTLFRQLGMSEAKFLGH